MGEVGHESAIAVEHVDDGGMVHQIRRTVFARHFLVVDAEGAGGGGDLLGRTAQAIEILSEIADIVFYQLRRVALGVDGDEHRIDLLVGARAELLDRGLEQQQSRRADVGAISVAEIDDGRLALEGSLGDGPAILVDQGERPTDGGRAVARRIPGDPARGTDQDNDPEGQQALHCARHQSKMGRRARLDKKDGASQKEAWVTIWCLWRRPPTMPPASTWRSGARARRPSLTSII